MTDHSHLPAQAHAMKDARIAMTLPTRDATARATSSVKLAARHLDFWYDKFHAVKDINLEIPEKQVTALIGNRSSRKLYYNGCIPEADMERYSLGRCCRCDGYKDNNFDGECAFYPIGYGNSVGPLYNRQ
jgi:hypothetical protein